jgi:LDH2 family malate/lactate/ureidoglycolate dehydrogenase
MTDFHRIAPHRLLDAAAAVTVALGVPEADARLLADTLVQAELWGHGSHGLLRLPWYVRRLQSGAMRALTRPMLVVDAGAVAVIDGDHGIGQVLAMRGIDEAVARARRHGVGAVALRRSNHFGTAMYFSRRAAEAGCVAMVFTNASPAMAPWGGAEKRVGTNPWSLAAPAGRHPIMVLDIANTAVARGKVYLARERGETIPEGWALDAQGTPTTDPATAIAGLIAPMAGHKGYAVAVMVDMLSGVLSGSAFGSAVHGPYEPDEASGCGHLMIALDIAAFMPPAEFGERMERLIADLKGARLADGSEGIFYPGEREALAALRHAREGLMLPVTTVQALMALGRELGVALALD